MTVIDSWGSSAAAATSRILWTLSTSLVSLGTLRDSGTSTLSQTMKTLQTPGTPCMLINARILRRLSASRSLRAARSLGASQTLGTSRTSQPLRTLRTLVGKLGVAGWLILVFGVTHSKGEVDTGGKGTWKQVRTCQEH